MASKTPSELLAALVTRRYPIPAEVWGDFWDRLSARDLHPGEALGGLSSLAQQIPGGSPRQPHARLAEGAQHAARTAAEDDRQHRRHGGRPEHLQPVDRVGVRR